MNSEKQQAAKFKALSDEARLKILAVLAKGQTCACKLLEDFCFTQPALSYHIKQLTDCGLVDAVKVGKWVHYSINRNNFAEVAEFIARFCGASDSTDNTYK